MTDPNEYAHPTIDTEPRYDHNRDLYAHVESTGGLTKREHFAAMAMQGLLAGEYRCATEAQAKEVAGHAVIHANALIAELNKETP